MKVKAPLCVICGRPNDGSIPFIGSICVNCLVNRVKLVDIPERIEIPMCRSCGRVRLGFKWFNVSDFNQAGIKAINYFFVRSKHSELVRKVEIKEIVPLTVPSWRTIYSVILSIRFQEIDKDFTQTIRIEVLLRPTLCPQCSNLHGGDYNVLIQLRGDVDINEALNLLEHLHPDDALKVVDVVEANNGANIYLLDRNVAEKIISLLKRRYRIECIKKSSEVVGVTRRGKVRRRLTILLRLSRGV